MTLRDGIHCGKEAARGRVLLWLAFIALLAVALRLAAGYGLATCPAAAHPSIVTDMATYRTLALQIRQGQWPAFFDYQPFYYTIVLPIAYCFSPTGGIWPVIIIQALLGGVTVYLTGLAAARLFGQRAGLAAALLLALSRFHVFYASFLLLEVWFSFWAIAVLYLTLRLLEEDAPAPARRRWPLPLLLGLCCGGALLTRGSALLWIPGIAAMALWRFWRQWKRLSLLTALFLAGFIAPIAPYSIHNSRHFGRFCGPSVAGGKVLVLGNSPEAPAGGLEYPRTYDQWCRQADSGERGVLSNILAWAWREPGAFLELECRKLLLFWDHTEIPNNISYEHEGSHSPILKVLLPWSILGTLGATGAMLLFCSRQRRRHAPLLWMMTIYWLATSAFYLLARFRVGAMPLLCCCAAYALQQLWHCRRNPALRPQSALALCIAALLVLLVYDRYCQFAEAPLFRSLRPDGLTLAFDKETVCYDHGPLLSAAPFALEFSTGDAIEVTKRFRAGEAFSELAAGQRALPQQLRLRIAGSGAGLSSRPRLAVNGITVPCTASFQKHFFADWLVLDFTAPIAAEVSSHETAFSIAFTPGTVPELLFDSHRDYGRTVIGTSDGQETLHAEAVAEWVVQM